MNNIIFIYICDIRVLDNRTIAVKFIAIINITIVIIVIIITIIIVTALRSGDVDPFGVLRYSGVQVGKSRFDRAARHSVTHQADQNVSSRISFHGQGASAVALQTSKHYG